VILPVWWDTYEYAARAEWLGIGVRGNKGVAPGVEGVQFGNALKQAVQDDCIRSKARQLGEVCRKQEGRVRAAEEIAKWAMKDKV
jgi:UDP:flavonoid glycosyltransferase YjiC (YdhE family)